MKKILILFCLLFPVSFGSFSQSAKGEFYEIRIYHLKNGTQEKEVDQYLEKALLPALHNAGIKKAGVFKPVQQDSADRKIFLLIPYNSLNDFAKVKEQIDKNKQHADGGKEYLNAQHSNPPYTRIESILIKSFAYHPKLQEPGLRGPREQRIYELRSYEGHTENIFRNKVQMFNQGGEVALFKRLGFNAVFYGEVIAGPRMPNLMYMTTFENQEDRDAHWNAFRVDPEWKKLSSMPEYQNNVSKIDITFLRPTSYSDF